MRCDAHDQWTFVAIAGALRFQITSRDRAFNHLMENLAHPIGITVVDLVMREVVTDEPGCWHDQLVRRFNRGVVFQEVLHEVFHVLFILCEQPLIEPHGRADSRPVAQQMVDRSPGLGYLRVLGISITVGFLLCVQISLVCVWRLLSLVRASSIFSDDAFTYELTGNPSSGGLGGGPIAATINVSVVDRLSRNGIDGAFVTVGDPATATYKGLTDDFGLGQGRGPEGSRPT